MPNVGKHAVQRHHQHQKCRCGRLIRSAPSTEYHGVVPVPDARLDKLAGNLGYQKTRHRGICGHRRFGEGCVQKGEGLGNKFFGQHPQICDAIVHGARCFERHGHCACEGNVDPVRDSETIDTELILSDLEVVSTVPARMAKARPETKALASAAVFRCAGGASGREQKMRAPSHG